jgi:hypothetical protein
MSMTLHVHTFQFMGLVYGYDQHPLAGSSARARYYEDKFFCTTCLEIRYVDKRYHGNSYNTLIEGAAPKESVLER